MEAEVGFSTHGEDACPEYRSSHLTRDYVRGNWSVRVAAWWSGIR